MSITLYIVIAFLTQSNLYVLICFTKCHHQSWPVWCTRLLSAPEFATHHGTIVVIKLTFIFQIRGYKSANGTGKDDNQITPSPVHAGTSNKFAIYLSLGSRTWQLFFPSIFAKGKVTFTSCCCTYSVKQYYNKFFLIVTSFLFPGLCARKCRYYKNTKFKQETQCMQYEYIYYAPSLQCC